MEIMKNFLQSKAEFGLNLHADCTFFLSALTGGFLPDIKLASIDFTMVASQGEGHMGLGKGIYIYLKVQLSFLKSFYESFKETVGKVLEFFGINLPDVDLNISLDVVVTIQDDVTGIMLKGNFGEIGTSLTCIFRYSDQSLSCSAKSNLFTVFREGIEFVAQKVEKFFERSVDQIRFILDITGKWIASNILIPTANLLQGKCKCHPQDEKQGLFCYPQCKKGYYGLVTDCVQDCPHDFRDDGFYCFKPSAYGRSTYWYEETCEQENKDVGCEQSGLFIYPKCKKSFYAFGCCICSPECPREMQDIGISCHKDTYSRGAGYGVICTEDGLKQIAAEEKKLGIKQKRNKRKKILKLK